MERIIVTDYIYPSIRTAYSDLDFHDQYAFRRTGSTTAAIISILNAVTSLLETNPYVSVTALDFSKAFDTVRHFTLLQKMSRLNVSDCIYNWLVNFFDGHSHCVRYSGEVSGLLDISASIIKGSALGRASYVIIGDAHQYCMHCVSCERMEGVTQRSTPSTKLSSSPS